MKIADVVSAVVSIAVIFVIHAEVVWCVVTRVLIAVMLNEGVVIAVVNIAGDHAIRAEVV
jgi:hypothetical protein